VAKPDQAENLAFPLGEAGDVTDRLNGAGGGNSVTAGHAHVHQDHVRLVLAGAARPVPGRVASGLAGVACQEMALMPSAAQAASISPVGAPETPGPATTLPSREMGRPPGRMLKPGMYTAPGLALA